MVYVKLLMNLRDIKKKEKSIKMWVTADATAYPSVRFQTQT